MDTGVQIVISSDARESLPLWHSVSNDWKTIVECTNNEIIVRDIATRSDVVRFKNSAGYFATSRFYTFGGREKILTNGSNGVTLTDVETGEEKHFLEFDACYGFTTFTPDEKFLLVLNGDRGANLWDVASEEFVLGIRGYQLDIPEHAEFSPDGRYVMIHSTWEHSSERALDLFDLWAQALEVEKAVAASCEAHAVEMPFPLVELIASYAEFTTKNLSAK